MRARVRARASLYWVIMENHEQSHKTPYWRAEYQLEEKIFRYELLDSSLDAFHNMGVSVGSLGLCSREACGLMDVAICYSSEGGIWLQGRQSCHSVSSCPVCSYNIGVHRVDELNLSIWCFRQFGFGVYLVTLTCHHTAEMSFNDLLLRLGLACNELFRMHEVRNFLKKLGMIGRITSYETMMLGENGYHPHYHILLIADENLDVDYIGKWLLKYWIKCLDKFGLWCNEHGLDCLSYQGVANYITKMASELTLLNFKRSSGESVTPFQCLKLYHDSKDMEIGKIWVNYCKAVKGKRILVWSRGLKNLAFTMHALLCKNLQHENSRVYGLLHLNNWKDYKRLSPVQWQEIIRQIIRGNLDYVKELLNSVHISNYINYNTLQRMRDEIDY